MSSVELRPGDTLNIVWSSVQETPLGLKEVESSFAFSYEDLLVKLRAKGKAGKSRRSSTDGARFSRRVALATNALRKGKWSTGADISRDEVFVRLMKGFNALNPEEYKNITPNAKEALSKIYQHDSYLSAAQKSELEVAILAIGKAS